MKVTFLLSVIFLFVSQSSFANYTLTDNNTGAQYTCGAGQGGTFPTDPNCVSKLTSYCHSNTSYTSSICFDKANQYCPSSGPNYVGCVSKTTSYCNSNTSYTATQCFDKALMSCRGQHLETLELMESVRAHTIQLQKSLFEQKTKAH